MGIVTGIIIDKFTELREEEEEFFTFCKNQCFICGKSSKEFDSDPTLSDFKQHIDLEHCIWDYIYFLAYLQYLDSNKFPLTFQEKYVLEKIKANDNTWFPCYKI